MMDREFMRLREKGNGKEPASPIGGFTLVELLVVMAILSGAMAAIYSLYTVQQRTAYIQEEVVEVQQNVRVAMDSISADLRNAGLLIPGTSNPVSAASNGGGPGGSDIVTLNTTSAASVFAVIDADLPVANLTAIPVIFTMRSDADVNLFAVGNIVRVISPGEQDQPMDDTGNPIDASFTVDALLAGPPRLRLIKTAGADATGVQFNKGDMIARTGGAPYPSTLMYCLGANGANCSGGATVVADCPAGQLCFIKEDNGTPAVVATNMTDLQFSYIQDSTTAEVGVPANFAQVRAVRTVITGATVDTAAISGTAKSREVNTVVKIRNR